MSALLIHGVPIECINQAARRYDVPAKIIIAVLNAEGGSPGLAKINKNGTVDYGPLQINSRWLSKIAPYGFNAKALQSDPCVNVEVATWILSQEIANAKTFWDGIGNYHSHLFLAHERYKEAVYMKFQMLERQLNAD